jgi:Uma2 family endonuclease
MSSAILPTTPGQRLSQPGEPPWEVAFLFPPQGKWSEEEYLALDTNRLVELSNGCLEVLPMPTVFHQFIVKFLLRVLDDFVTAQGLGSVLFAPLPVWLWTGTYREPDLVFLRRGRRKRHGQPEGADLVMEVVSEGVENRKRDFDTKRQEYAAAGISEYWIIDPEKHRITVLTLDGQTYRVHGKFGGGANATSILLPGFSVSVDAVFAAAQSE